MSTIVAPARFIASMAIEAILLEIFIFGGAVPGLVVSAYVCVRGKKGQWS